ncbi:CO/xanthine dehydrogenase FAD-binding subunit [Streptomyces sp. TLI_55]|uniref:FAD binding domain-containing protein n=1 Tax=Streptomyces sp. TLI_55 TaxID=1938861 RepID=UPI000BDA22BC|nr:FAD binding domain-containing protein [Streptomyces sp. TLI_55]SNX58351.1 CO/xanthine dehydrogenase FAD-binding subunit [Streptomyces sp. TLI_55]
MLLRLPTSVSEARQCLSEGAIPVGGATLQWAVWQRDGFPRQAMSLREVPEANVLGAGELGAAVLLHRIDERVPEVLRRAAAGIGTGAVRKSATVGGNIVGSTLRCLLPAAVVLDARAVVLDTEGPYETDLAELTAKRPLLLSLRWRTPLASAYRKLSEAPGGPPPLVVATAVHAPAGLRPRLRIAVRDGYDVLAESTECDSGAESVLDALTGTAIGTLPAEARAVVRDQVTELLARTPS